MKPIKLKPLTKKQEKDLDGIFDKIKIEWEADMIPVVKQLHPDAKLIIPLYRSALVVPPQTKEEIERGSCKIILYHDPHWVGHDKITTQNLPQFKEIIGVHGQCSGPDLTVEYIDEKTGQWIGRKHLVPMTKEERNKWWGLDKLFNQAPNTKKAKTRAAKMMAKKFGR